MVALQVTLPEAIPEEHVALLRDQLHGHFADLRCGDHDVASLEIQFVRSPRELLCCLSPCCTELRHELQTHIPCAAELAAIYGLKLVHAS